VARLRTLSDLIGRTYGVGDGVRLGRSLSPVSWCRSCCADRGGGVAAQRCRWLGSRDQMRRSSPSSSPGWRRAHMRHFSSWFRRRDRRCRREPPDLALATAWTLSSNWESPGNTRTQAPGLARRVKGGGSKLVEYAAPRNACDYRALNFNNAKSPALAATVWIAPARVPLIRRVTRPPYSADLMNVGGLNGAHIRVASRPDAA
jgi:hypothetical protein